MKVGDLVLVAFLILAFSALIGAICWPYTINTWLEYAESPNRIVWWHGALMGFVPVVGQASIPAAVVTWALTLFLV